LIRRLENEGTTFKEILDDIRRRLALNYVGSRDLDLNNTAFLLGFSHATAFHRAFKRWTDQTPLEYRRSRRR
jgi:AraC-like DNA-binding protein